VPLFTIVTVCRNAQNVIEETGLSLRNQSCQDFEWLVIDGASSDGTLERVAGLGLAQGRVLSEPDHGIFDAMNKAVPLARGKWIYFLNAGDSFADAAVLADVSANLRAHPKVELLWGDMIYFDQSSEWLRRFAHVSAWTLPFEWLCHQAVFASRDLFDRFGYFNEAFSLGADADWLLRVFRSGATTRYIERVIARFEVGGFHSSNPTLGLSQNRAMRLQYVSPTTLWLGYRLASVRRRWRMLLGRSERGG
jgi:glycosyltransferase involved in cell wall biosynthesis